MTDRVEDSPHVVHLIFSQKHRLTHHWLANAGPFDRCHLDWRASFRQRAEFNYRTVRMSFCILECARANSKYRTVLTASITTTTLKSRPHQQQSPSNVRLCRSNIRLCCQKRQECRSNLNVERIARLVAFDNVASTDYCLDRFF